MFLIRDWGYDEDKYRLGFDGGEMYGKKFTTQLMRQSSFAHVFGRISCFLLPHPGSAVKREYCRFKGNLKVVSTKNQVSVADVSIA